MKWSAAALSASRATASRSLGLVPEEEARRAQAAEAIERLKALRKEFGKAPLDEILASRHEGHKS